MNDGMKTADLFTCDVSYIYPLLQEEYPWGILPKIREYILSFINDGAKGFQKIKEGVYVGNNVKISPFATIEAPCIIGDNTEIRTGAYIRGNVITGTNCVIGNSSELKNCVLLNNVQVPHYNYVGDSILGNFAHMGAGAICSNLKSDKKPIVIRGKKEHRTNLRKVGAFLADFADIGCGCVLNPGTIVGKNTSIYPLTAVRGVIPSNSIVKAQGNVVKKQK
ncbi:MAG: UDP-N-acetylglucosamine pyrophosphorylase [Clostridia bacterium]|nr:UDP-N-acetylglucosamine pyrophosphorylase [Clostridia bacterium]